MTTRTRKASTNAKNASNTEVKETEMPEAKKTVAKKTTAKKTTARKPAGRKPAGGRTKRVVKPMTQVTREFAASVVGHATDAAMANEDLGVKRTASSDMKLKNGIVNRIVLDDGTRIVVTVRVNTK